VPLIILSPPLFSNYSFLVHHSVNRDDRQFLAQAMASAFLGYAIKVRFSLYVPLNCTPFKGGEQGDQIGRILANWVKVYLGQF
jgi:hypothetical protein